MQLVTIFKNEIVISKKCSVCTNFLERARGLLFRPPLTVLDGDALLIPKCNSIHTFLMQYSIAVIFLDSQKKIVFIDPNVPPSKIIRHKQAQYALELASGNLWSSQLQVGNSLYW